MSKERVLLLKICSPVRLYGLHIVQITKTVIREVKRLIFLQKYEVSITEVERKIANG